jgi:PiT family inorganic phosphate transporter
MSSAIMGAGSAERLSKVRWLIGYEMMIAWVLTIPISAILAGFLYVLLTLIFPG